MVVLVDLDDGGFSDPPHLNLHTSDPPPYRDVRKPIWPPVFKNNEDHSVQRSEATKSSSDDRPNPNLNGFSAALSCYPIVSQLASLLDLNDLHSLSRTCRQFRANLLQFRDQLVTQTLRCSKEDEELGMHLGTRLREMQLTWSNNQEVGHRARITSGKIGRCARDFVGECRRCGTVVCRNCTAKPLPTPCLIGRHRRLCRTCSHAPIALHLCLDPPIKSPRSTPSSSPSRLYRIPTPDRQPRPEAFTAPAFQRSPCRCPEEFWLCAACGHALRANDTTYARGWTWRTRYSAYLGGLGTGIGEGNEGVQCGRESACLAAKLVEHELDCDNESLAELQRDAEKVERDGSGRSWRGTSFMVQEMEGVGGVVKKKVKKLVRVGQEVEEYEDEREREKGDYMGTSSPGSWLVKEKTGEARSWCAWCERVIPSKEDETFLKEQAKLREHVQ